MTLGGRPGHVGNTPVVEFPGVTVYLQAGSRPTAPTGGTVGSSVDHVGFTVQDIKVAMAEWSGAGVPVEPSPFGREDQAWIMTGDELRIEILEETSQLLPIQHHHVHYSIPETRIAEAQAWYGRVFGAVKSMRGNFQSSDIPSANLTWGVARQDNVGTEGRALDHVGFLVEDIDAFCRHARSEGIDLDRPCASDSTSGQTRAYLYDPFGTYLMVSEGS